MFFPSTFLFHPDAKEYSVPLRFPFISGATRAETKTGAQATVEAGGRLAETKTRSDVVLEAGGRPTKTKTRSEAGTEAGESSKVSSCPSQKSKVNPPEAENLWEMIIPLHETQRESAGGGK